MVRSPHLSIIGKSHPVRGTNYGGKVNGAAFAKIKHGSLWLKVDQTNIKDFVERGMVQYSYGKNKSRKLNFFETPAEVLEDADRLTRWASKAYEAAIRPKTKRK